MLYHLSQYNANALIIWLMMRVFFYKITRFLSCDKFGDPSRIMFVDTNVVISSQINFHKYNKINN